MNNNLENKIKVACVGCGRIVANHIKAIISNNDNLELLAICDLDEDKIIQTENLIKEFSIQEKVLIPKFKKFNNYGKLLDFLKLNVNPLSKALIVLTTPSGLHREQTIKAADYGINVLTEKPMATNLNDAKRMIDACKKQMLNYSL